MNDIITWFYDFFDGLTETQTKGITTLLIIVLLWLLQRFVLQSVLKLQSNLATRYNWRKNTTYAIYMVGIVAIILVWSNNFGDFATFLGLLSAGLAIAFQEPIVNMAGWYFILLQKPFKVGDRIQVDQQIGDVVDINLFQFTIVEVGNWVNDEQSTGRIIHIPNAQVFRTPIANYNEGLDYIWDELPVLVTFESDWKKCKAILNDVLTEHAPKVSESAKKELQNSSGQYLIYYNKVTPIIYTSVEASGVLLTLRYLCVPKKRRITKNILWEHILDHFNAPGNEDMDFAYPTRRTITSGPDLTRPIDAD